MPVSLADLRILHYPASALRAKARPIDDVNEEVRAVAQRMIELMREANGVGLAAPQVGLPWRMFVTNVPDEGQARVYINPSVTPLGRERAVFEEGCLSLPGIHVEIERPTQVQVNAIDADGNAITVASNGFPARVWQHEADHLDGVLIIDKMSQMDRLALRRTLKDMKESAEAGRL